MAVVGSLLRQRRARLVRGVAGVAVAGLLGSMLAMVPFGAVRPAAAAPAPGENVVSWGGNGSGQLGDGTTTTSSTPVGTTGVVDAVSVAAGHAHGLAATSDGTVLAWGRNESGQLGDGTTTDRLTAAAVDGLSGVTQTSAEASTSMALAAGEVWAWGGNESGKLGPEGAGLKMSAVPLKVTGLSGVTQIATGVYHGLALKGDGTVWAWGAWRNLGNGQTTDSATPVQASIDNVVAVAAGGMASYALRADGTVWAWGYNTDGQLGDGTNSDSPVPVQVQGLAGIVDIAGGGSHALAVGAAPNGQLFAWGNNSNGQLGDGTTVSSNVPLTVSGIRAVVDAEAGHTHSLAAISTGGVSQWGLTNTYTLVPTAVAGITAPHAMEGGQYHSVAILSAPEPSGPGRIVFTSTSDGGDREIYVMGDNGMQADGSGRTQLTSNSFDDSFPDWSPEAKRIVFESDRPDTGTTPADLDVFVMRSDGSNVVNLTGEHPGYDGVAAWSPDGSRIAFVSDRGTDGRHVWLMDTNGGTKVQLTATSLGASYGRPSWSPAGDRIVVHRADGDLYAINVADGTEQRLTTDAYSDMDAAWSPDGRHIAYMSNRGSGHQIHILDLETGASRKLTPYTGTEGIPTFSPDGRLVAYSRSDAGNEEIYVSELGPDSLLKPQQLTFSAGSEARPSWATNLSLTVGYPPVDDVLMIGDGALIDPGLSSPAALGLSMFTSPSQVPLIDIPAQLSPHVVDTAPTANLPLTAPTANVPLLAPTANLPLTAPTANLPLLVPTANLPLLAPTANLPLLAPTANLPLLAPAAQQVLSQISLGSLVFAGGVEQHLLNSALAGRQPQDISLLEAILDPVVGPRLAALRTHEVHLGATLGGVGLGAILLGPDTDLADYGDTGFDFCAALDGLRQRDDCSADLGGLGSLSMLDLQVLGLNVSDGDHGIPFHTFRLGDIDLDPSAQLLDADISATDLATSSLGSVLIRDIPTATRADVVDCTNVNVDCTTARLYDAKASGAMVAGASFADLGTAVDGLSLGEVVFGLVGLDVTPYEAFPPDQLGILTYNGVGSSQMRYEMRYVSAGGGTAAPTFRVTLPSSFAAAPSSVQLLSEGLGGEVAVLGHQASLKETDAGVELTVTTPATLAAGDVAILRFTGYPGLEIGVGVSSASVWATSVNQSIANQAPVTVQENHEDNDDPATAIGIQPDVLYLASPGDDDFYTFSAQPGSLVEVFLGNAGSGDSDLVAYYPEAVHVADPLRAPKGTARNVRAILDSGPTLIDGGEPLSAETREDIDLVDRPVAGLSDNRSRENEVARFIALPGGDDSYLIQVSPYLDDATAGPYSLRVRITDPPQLPPCQVRSFPFGEAAHVSAISQAPTSIAADRETIFLVDWARLSRFYDDPATQEVETQLVADKLAELAAHPKVNGVVVPLNAYSSIQAEQAEADQNPCAVEPTNDVVRATNAVVDGLLAGSDATIGNVVAVGSEEVVARAMVPDVTQVGNEALFTPDLQLAFPGENNSLIGAGSHVRTDDPYGDLSPTPYLGRWLYTPDLAVGRLVETPKELLKAMQTFIDYDGIIKSKATFTASSDLFMQDVSKAQDAVAEEFMGGNAQPDLIETPGDISTRWTSTNLGDALRGPVDGDAPQVAMVNAHADQFRFEAPGSPQDPFTTADLDAIGDRIAGTVLLTMGCHSAQSPADVLLGADATRVRDWAQVVSGKGGVFAGQSGYGLGLEATMAFTEDVMLRMTQGALARAADGSAAMTVGQALLAAKQGYIAEKGTLSVYDEKAAVQTTLFGLPMFEIERDPSIEPTTTSSTASTASTSVLEVSPLATDADTGLQAVTVHSEPAFQRKHVAGLGYYDAVDGKTYEAHYRPVQPKVAVDVTQSGLRAHGAAPVALESSDESGFDPVFAMPALASDPSQPAEPQFGNVIFPAAPTTLSSVGDRDTLVLVPGQFQGRGLDANGNVIGEQTRITSSDTVVWYSHSDDFIEPVIRSFEAYKDGQTVLYQAEVTDETPTGKGSLALVYVLFRDDNGWHNVKLRQVGTSDRFVASASFTGAEPESSVVGVDLGGNVGSSWNKGDRFDAALLPPAVPGVETEVTSPKGAVNGWYHESTVTIDAGGQAVQYSLNGEPFVDYTGPLALTTTGIHTIDYRVVDGNQGTLVVPVDLDPPAITGVSAPLDPQPVGTAVTASLAFDDPRASSNHAATVDWGDGTAATPLTVTATPGSGEASGSHAYAAPGIYTLTFNLTDPEGLSDSQVYEYVVVYDPDGGFVTGGGHISSPAGAYTPDPTLTGKATFGFVSKYKKGAITPSGTTQFRFHAAGMQFFSDVYEWLVVSGARAQYKGHGSINGESGYSFLLTAVDGQVNGGGGTDKLRMKIWRTLTGEVVYDNQLGDGDDAELSTAITGGSITIKK